MKIYNETWRYKYYNFRQVISIWFEGGIERYYCSRKKQWLAKFIFEKHRLNSSYWFYKIVDLINEIHGRQKGQIIDDEMCSLIREGKSGEANALLKNNILEWGGGWG